MASSYALTSSYEPHAKYIVVDVAKPSTKLPKAALTTSENNSRTHASRELNKTLVNKRCRQGTVVALHTANWPDSSESGIGLG